MKTLKPIRQTTEEYEEIERKIIELFRKRIYLPLIKEFSPSSKVILNAIPDLREAIRSGRVTFNKGTFSGAFNSTISKELRSLGAKFDAKTGTYKIALNQLPIDYRIEISASFDKFRQKVDAIDKHLSAIVPEELAKELKITKIFDTAIYKTDKSVSSTLAVQPQLNKEQRAKIAKDWSNNMDLWIRDFTQKQIKDLRKDIQKSVFAGNRFGSAVDLIKKSYRVTENKAKFLAKQETKLLTTKLAEVMYVDAGLTKYKWHCVAGTPLHPTRPMHKELNDRSLKGEIFDFNKPPVDDPNGSRHNPGQNYNCRCTALVVVDFRQNLPK